MDTKNKILCGDSLEVLKDFEDNYFDSAVTDPPYGLAFMGKKWDYDVPQVELWKEVHRVIKPGGHLLSFAGSRTYHRMAVNIEDAGFEIRDMLGWLYGSGFPKSHNIGKAVDKLQGNKRDKLGKFKNTGNSFNKVKGFGVNTSLSDKSNKEWDITKGNSEWEGWGTALKPAHEPIVMARKPFNTSVAENVLKHGTGGINIDECRVGTDEKLKFERKKESTTTSGWRDVNRNPYEQHNEGRFPANIIHDGSEEVLEIFPETKSGSGIKNKNPKKIFESTFKSGDQRFFKADSGTAARFFYCAKASKAERDMGLKDLVWEKQRFETKEVGHGNLGATMEKFDTKGKNNHPTVKPIKLMEYLVRLVTPKEGIVLEPFAGSGTTLIACKQEGFNYIGIEREQEYCDIAEARLKSVQIQGELF